MSIDRFDLVKIITIYLNEQGHDVICEDQYFMECKQLSCVGCGNCLHIDIGHSANDINFRINIEAGKCTTYGDDKLIEIDLPLEDPEFFNKLNGMVATLMDKGSTVYIL